MKALLVFVTFAGLSFALINDLNEDCIVMNPIGNTIVTAGEKMKIQWSNTHTDRFESIYLVQSDGVKTPIIIATDIFTSPNNIIVDLPWNLTPSNAYYMTLGKPPFHCNSGNLRIMAATSPPPLPNNPFDKGISTTLGVYPKEEEKESGVDSLSTDITSFAVGLLAFFAVHILFF